MKPKKGDIEAELKKFSDVKNFEKELENLKEEQINILKDLKSVNFPVFSLFKQNSLLFFMEYSKNECFIYDVKLNKKLLIIVVIKDGQNLF